MEACIAGAEPIYWDTSPWSWSLNACMLIHIVENLLSHKNDNNRCLLKWSTLERQGFLTISTYLRFSIAWWVIWWVVFNLGYIVVENINYLIFSSYLYPFRDKFLTTIFILFTWLLIIWHTHIINYIPCKIKNDCIHTSVICMYLDQDISQTAAINSSPPYTLFKQRAMKIWLTVSIYVHRLQ